MRNANDNIELTRPVMALMCKTPCTNKSRPREQELHAVTQWVATYSLRSCGPNPFFANPPCGIMCYRPWEHRPLLACSRCHGVERYVMWCCRHSLPSPPLHSENKTRPETLYPGHPTRQRTSQRPDTKQKPANKAPTQH